MGHVDTLGSCLFNCKLSIDEVIKVIDQLSIQFQTDLIDGLELYEKHYTS